ncbi:MAG TPA: transcriptional repressor [Arcobacter sp.]|jgi:Fur family peroxide stress response transcriptional regulator|nr:transcriptional repressor [Arcobacter sp.]
METNANLLREYNLKATPQRLAIIEVVTKSGHINIDSLYEEIKKRFNSISLATIYKNINSMTENGLLLEVKLPNTKSVYEMNKEKHAHLKCDNCGSIKDIQIDMNEKFEEVSKEHNFELTSAEVVLSGTSCSSCA